MFTQASLENSIVQDEEETKSLLGKRNHTKGFCHLSCGFWLELGFTKTVFKPDISLQCSSLIQTFIFSAKLLDSARIDLLLLHTNNVKAKLALTEWAAKKQTLEVL